MVGGYLAHRRHHHRVVVGNPVPNRIAALHFDTATPYADIHGGVWGPVGSPSAQSSSYGGAMRATQSSNGSAIQSTTSYSVDNFWIGMNITNVPFPGTNLTEYIIFQVGSIWLSIQNVSGTRRIRLRFSGGSQFIDTSISGYVWMACSGSGGNRTYSTSLGHFATFTSGLGAGTVQLLNGTFDELEFFSTSSRYGSTVLPFLDYV